MRDRFLRHPLRVLSSAGVALAFVLLTGCAGTAPLAPPPAETEAAVEAAPTAAPIALPEAKPTRLLVPAIDVDTTAVIELGRVLQGVAGQVASVRDASDVRAPRRLAVILLHGGFGVSRELLDAVVPLEYGAARLRAVVVEACSRVPLSVEAKA